MRDLPLQKLLFATLAMSCLLHMTSRKASTFHQSQCHAFSTIRLTLTPRTSSFSTSSPFPPSFSQRHDYFHRTFLFLPTKNIQRNPIPPTTKLNLSKSNTSPTPPPPLPQNTEDPFLLLGLDTPTADLREIKRAYRKRAMQYHPDVVINADSSSEEREKASRDFARINAAYEMLKGGGSGSGGAASSGGANASSRAGTSSYVPPHRRQGGYSSSSYGSKSANNNNNVRSTNWEDYMPNYEAEDAKYDADGDSFGAIFSDLISGAVGAASGYGSSGAGIFGDFVDFLERNVDGFQSGYDDDKSLSALLMYGSFEEIAEEMDETDMLVTSLEKKLSTVENERMQIEADLKLAQRYSEKLDLEERKEELNAREKVVKGYLKKGRSRLVRLRERYKELMVQGRGGRGYGTGTSRSGSSGGRTNYDSASRSSSQRTTTSSASSTSSSTYSTASSAQSSAASSSKAPTSSPATASSSSSGSSWRNEGFSGGYGRRSSSSRRGRRASSSGTADASSTASSTNDYASNRSRTYQSSNKTQTPRENVYGNGTYGSSSSSGSSRSSNILANDSLNKEAWKPPHRRTESATESAAREKRRLRELKVDDEFERLKKEMGL